VVIHKKASIIAAKMEEKAINAACASTDIETGPQRDITIAVNAAHCIAPVYFSLYTLKNLSFFIL
jgi:hypothetical protein